MSDSPIIHKDFNILVVDDTLANLKLLTEMLQGQGYNIRPARNGKSALRAAAKDPPDLILLDINMPEMNGYEVCQKIKADDRLNDIPVLFISALEDSADKLKAFSVGGLDYISKPFEIKEVNARVETHLRLHQFQIQLERIVEDQVKEIQDSQMSTIFALAKLAESRDDETGKHIERVQSFCKSLVVKLGETSKYKRSINGKYIDNLYHANPLHDIGKVGISDNILLKPGKLTAEEFEIIKTHTTIGSQTLEYVSASYPKNAFINMGIELSRSHHEKWDGSGYPDGLTGEDIPLSARILAVSDVYDALRSKRPYKEAFPHKKSVEIISKDSGSHFDPEIVKTFLEIEEEFKKIHESLSDL